MPTGLGRIALGIGAIVIGALAARSRSASPDRRAGASALDTIRRQQRNTRRKPPEAGLPAPAIPPGGPLPKRGGAAAPLDFETSPRP